MVGDLYLIHHNSSYETKIVCMGSELNVHNQNSWLMLINMMVLSVGACIEIVWKNSVFLTTVGSRD